MSKSTAHIEKLPTDDASVLDRFKNDIVIDADAMDDQRTKANEDMRFVNVDGGTWEDFREDTFDGRVKLELDIISNPLQRFIGEWNQNRAGVDFKPDDEGTNKDDAELINGIYRSDFRDHGGSVSTDNAVVECATVGFGCFKLATEFDDEGDPENDNQHLEWRPIYNAYNTVFWDQSALRIDKADARHCTVLKQFTRQSFESEYPEYTVSSAYTPETRIFGANALRNNASSVEIFYVATRYEVKKVRTTVYIFNNLSTEKVETYSEDDYSLVKDELAADETRIFVRKRKISHQVCERTVFSGEDILDETRRIAGKYIPVVSMYGYRAYVDGTERYRGIVRKLKDPQRLYNVQVSQLAENSASNGQEVPVFLREQVQNPHIANSWADKNNVPYLVVDPAYDNDGTIIATGPVGFNKPGMLDQSTTALLTIVPNHIRESSGFEVGEAINKETSGKAMNALIKRENMNTQVINDNISSSIQWSGEIYQSMAQEVYTTKRMMRTLQRDGTDGTEMMLSSVMDTQTGEMVESNDLRGKKFKAYADVGPQYESVREQTVEDMKGLLEILPAVPGGEEYVPIALSVMMDNISGTGLTPLKEFNRRKMLSLGIVDPRSDEEEAFLAQMQQQSSQPDPQQELMKAAAEQQHAEARNLDAASAEKVASTGLKEAQTAKTLASIGQDEKKLETDEMKAFADIRQKSRELLAKLPIGRDGVPG